MDENVNIFFFEVMVEIKIGLKDGDKVMINVNFLILFFFYFKNYDLGVIVSFCFICNYLKIFKGMYGNEVWNILYIGN